MAQIQDLEAKIILEWDDGELYISDIKTFDKVSGNPIDVSIKQNSSSGTIVPMWDAYYKYALNDVIAYEGVLYVSNENQNVGYNPDDGFWWSTIVDLSAVNAITIDGRTFEEIGKELFEGTKITDYYLKSDLDVIILDYFNKVDARKLEGWTRTDIQNDYITRFNTLEKDLKEFVSNYLRSETDDSYQKELITYFDSVILPDDINLI